jgi:HEAT repeat protein
MTRTRIFIRCFAAVLAMIAITAQVAGGQEQSSAKEQELIAVLQNGQPADKAIACKELAIHGSKAAVPELAKLLADEQLVSWARIALEAIPDPAADEALRNALDTAQGRALIGVINSIGVRRDAQAVEPLQNRLQSADGEVASAAAIALGNIGTAQATQALRGCRGLHPLRRTADEGWQAGRGRGDL